MTLRLIFLAAAMAAPTAAQTTFYVDAAVGNDAGSGTSPTDPWRTLTRATTETFGASAPTTIEVAPGTYDVPLGESFPIVVGPSVTILGDQSILDGGRTPTPLGLDLVGGANPGVHGIEGVWMQGFDVGIRTDNTVFGSRSARVKDVIVIGARTGIRVQNTDFSTESVIEIEGTQIQASDHGILAVGRTDVTLKGIELVGVGTGTGLRTSTAGAARLRGDRISIRGFDRGVDLRAEFGIMDAELERLAVTQCAIGASWLTLQGSSSLRLSRSTIAGNDLGFLRTQGESFAIAIDRSIIAGNGTDVLPQQGTLSISASLVPSGDLNGPGVLQVDPMLRNPAQGDLRLERGSPAIDAVSGGAGAIDGNLDGLPVLDYGAFEYETMRPILPLGELGTTQRLLVDGDGDGTSSSFGVGILAEAPLPGFGIFTGYGRFDLNRASARRAGLIPFAAGATSAAWTFDLPSDPALSGQTWSVQALVPAFGLVAPLAFTQAIEFTLR